MATKKLNVPDIGGLLGDITKKQREMPKAPIQSVQPVEEKTAESKNGNTPKQQNSMPEDQPQPEATAGGLIERPSMKKDSIEKVKTSPRIPKQQNDMPENQPQPEPLPRGLGGRPSRKKDSIEYVKISPRIPKALKRDIEHALTDERFKDEEKNPIKTLDEIVAYALDQLFVKK